MTASEETAAVGGRVRRAINALLGRDIARQAEAEVAIYRKALTSLANWQAMDETGDMRLIRCYARATLNEAPWEARAARAALAAAQVQP